MYEKRPRCCEPTIVIHGGAGAIRRQNLPPELYDRYQLSLSNYLIKTQAQLQRGSSALDAACYAVSLLEDDPLFNCGRGAVFTEDGTIELEASVMVASIFDGSSTEGAIKRTGAVSGIRNTRHPIQLARMVLLDAEQEDGCGPPSSMHCHLSGHWIEARGWEKGLEYKDDDWFWTKRRWDEHRRGLEDRQKHKGIRLDTESLPSQGTVGVVCVDAWGNIAVSTSTGGLTNKAPGRVGDTPTVGSGFWAESWESTAAIISSEPFQSLRSLASWFAKAPYALRGLAGCFPSSMTGYRALSNGAVQLPETSHAINASPAPNRTIVAMSGTGNGDSFLRIAAARTAASLCRLSSPQVSLAKAVSAIAGPGGELQRSAGDRWMKTGEGEGGIIGIELHTQGVSGLQMPSVVFDFNCGGMWRAWYDRDSQGILRPKVMVFRDDYYQDKVANCI